MEVRRGGSETEAETGRARKKGREISFVVNVLKYDCFLAGSHN